MVGTRETTHLPGPCTGPGPKHSFLLNVLIFFLCLRSLLIDRRKGHIFSASSDAALFAYRSGICHRTRSQQRPHQNPRCLGFRNKLSPGEEDCAIVSLPHQPESRSETTLA